MISLARPQIHQFFARVADENFVGRLKSFGDAIRLRITFVGEGPEMDSVAMLGLGALGLPGPAAMRPR